MPTRDNPATRSRVWLSLLLTLFAIVPSSGCAPLLASGVYFWQGGNLVAAQCDALKKKRVVVFCSPPSSAEYRHPGAARQIAERLSSLLEMNVPGVDVVSQREVDNWLDENDSDDYKALGQAVQAQRVLRVELDHFRLLNGKTLYQGSAGVTVSVHDIEDNGRLVWEREMGDVKFPANSAVPIQDRTVQEFQRQYVQVLSGEIARHFYRHDPTAAFANDALAHR